MTWVDLAVLGVLAISALLAFMRGLVREVLGIGAWAGAVAAAVEGLPLVRPMVRNWIGASPWVDPVSFVGVFVITLIILSLIARAIGRSVRGSALGGVDRTLGLVFGLARGAALVMVAYLIGGMLVSPQQWPEPVQRALFLPVVCVASHDAVSLLPADKDAVGKYMYRPQLWDCPPERQTTADALLQAAPQGRATGKPPIRD
jgi:membrane protein required for colicin V production